MHYKTAVNTNGQFLGVFIKQVCQEKQENMLGFQGALASFHFSFKC